MSVCSVTSACPCSIIERELEGFGIRLNKKKPNIYMVRKEKGGVSYRSMFPQPRLDEETVRAICAEYKIHNADITIRCVTDFVRAVRCASDGRCLSPPSLPCQPKHCLSRPRELQTCITLAMLIRHPLHRLQATELHRRRLHRYHRRKSRVRALLVRHEQDRRHHHRGAGPA